MIASLADRLLTLQRVTPMVLDAVTVAASHSADRNPVRASLLTVTISGGTTGNGTVTVAGTVEGASDSEVLTFTVNGTKRTAKLFTAINSAGITTSGLADEATKATISVKALDKMGSPQHGRYTVKADIPAAITYRSSGGGGSGAGDTFVAREGQTLDDQAMFAIDYAEAFTPQAGDLLFDTHDNSRTWLIRGPPRLIRAMARPHHWELTCSRYEEP